jgi:methylmalonyl-CoA/ethylmalonyl-CoA epimerase
MFKGVDHVVIAVKDIETSIKNYENIYGAEVSDRSESPAAGMTMAFFRFDDSYIELVSNVGDEGPIAKRLANLGEGVHLVATRAFVSSATRAPETRSPARCSFTPLSRAES